MSAPTRFLALVLMVRLLDPIVVAIVVGTDRALGLTSAGRSSFPCNRLYYLHRPCTVPSDSSVALGSWGLLSVALIVRQRCLEL